MEANSARRPTAIEDVVQNRKDNGAYFVHEIPKNYFEGAIRRDKFSPSEVAAALTSTTAAHDDGHLQGGAMFSRQVLANPTGSQKANNKTWGSGQVGSSQPIAVVFTADILNAGPAVARTFDGKQIGSNPIPQRSHPITALQQGLTNTEKLSSLTQNNAEVGVSGEIPLSTIAGIIVKPGNPGLVEELKGADYIQSKQLQGKIFEAERNETKQQTISRVHTAMLANADG